MITRIRLHTHADPTGRCYVDMEDDELAAATLAHLLDVPNVTLVTVEKDPPDEKPLASYRWYPCNCPDPDCTTGVLEDRHGRVVEYGNSLYSGVRHITRAVR